MSRSAQITAALAFGLLIPAALSQAASPIMETLIPRGAQRGTEVTAEFTGARLNHPLEIIFHQPGIRTLSLEPAGAGRVRATLRIEPDCPLGLHALRLRTASGVSNIKLFSVGNLPEIAETEPNGNRANPQMLAPPVTVNGVIEAEDVDLFGFDAKAGQTLAFEVEALRLGDTLFDPVLFIHDTAGNEIAAADDTPLLRQDAALVVTFPADGRYVVGVRETAFGGSSACRYRLHAGQFPRPFAASPAGGLAGMGLDLKWIGDPTAATQRVTLPVGPAGLYPIFPTNASGIAPSPIPIRVSSLLSRMEAEPNDSDAAATVIPVPGAVSGVIDRERDVDCFSFDARAGQTLDAQVFARRLGSPLDPILHVRHHGGAGLAGNDDSGGPDSVLRFTCPADGKYTIEVRDLLFKGGEAFTYHLELATISPQLTLSLPPDTTAAVAVPRGNRAAILVTAARPDFGGPLRIEATGLPAGVTMHADIMHEAVGQMPIVFEAAPDVPLAAPASQPTATQLAGPASAPDMMTATPPASAPAGPLGSALVDLTARHADPARQISGCLSHNVVLVTHINDQPFYGVTIDRLAVAATDPIPYSVTIVEPKVPIVRRGLMQLPVRVERQGVFKGAITIRMLWNPPGIGAGTLNLTAEQSEGVIPLNAAENAMPGKWRIAVVAASDVNGPVEVSSQLATLEVAEPFLDFTIARTRAEVGKPVEVAVQVAHKTPFDGQATADLLGLPAKVAATQATFTKETSEIRYALSVDPATPPGQHGLLVRAVVTRDGQPIIHQSPYGLLVIDAPLPPPDPAAEAARAEARRKAEEEKARKKAERIAAAEARRKEREAKRKEPDGGKP